VAYLTETSGAVAGSPASLDYVAAVALNKTAPGGDTMTGPLTVQAQVTIQGLNGYGTAPTIAGVTHCVASAPAGHDLGGSFVLTTDSTSVTAGTIATVTFGTALANAPAAVVVTLADTTAAALAGVGTVYVTAITGTGFTVANSAAMTASSTYLVTYIIVAS